MSETMDAGIGMAAYAPARPVPLGLRLANKLEVGEMLLRRWGGCWIDLLALGAIFLLAGFASEAASWIAWVGLIAILAYFPVTEGVWGRSLGKLVTGTIVVDKNGKIPGVGRVVVRTLFRLFEVNPFMLGGLPAAAFVGFSKTRQRLGDMVAGTYVVIYKDLKYARERADAAVFE